MLVDRENVEPHEGVVRDGAQRREVGGERVDEQVEGRCERVAHEPHVRPASWVPQAAGRGPGEVGEPAAEPPSLRDDDVCYHLAGGEPPPGVLLGRPHVGLVEARQKRERYGALGGGAPGRRASCRRWCRSRWRRCLRGVRDRRVSPLAGATACCGALTRLEPRQSIGCGLERVCWARLDQLDQHLAEPTLTNVSSLGRAARTRSSAN